MGFVIVENVAKGDLWDREVPFQIRGSDFPPGSNGRSEIDIAIERWNEQAPHIPLVDKGAQHEDFAVFVRHEQQRPDQEEFIRLLPAGIESGDFNIINDGSFEPIGVYDYDSIMHYPIGEPPEFEVLRLDEQPGAVVGQRSRLSERDIQATLYLYGFRVSRSVAFGTTAVGDIKTRQLTLVNHLARDLRISTGTVSPGFFRVVQAFPATVDPFRTVSATVEYRPAAPGDAKATLALAVENIGVSVRLSGRASTAIEPE